MIEKAALNPIATISPAAIHWLPGQSLFGQSIHVAAIALEHRTIVTDGLCGDAATIDAVRAIGRPVLIHLSHGPSFNESHALVRALDAEVVLHEGDRRNFWLGRNRRFCRFWSGERLVLAPGVEAVHIGGHSIGHDLLHVEADEGLLFTGDAVKVGEDGAIAWDRGVARRLSDPCYARYLRAQILSVPFDSAISLHGGLIPDARRRLTALLEA